MVGVVIFRPVLRELDSLRMNREARFLLPEPVVLWPSSLAEDLLSSPEPLVSIISEGDRGVLRGGVPISRSLLVERRLEMLRRRASPCVVCTEGGREGDFEGVNKEAGEARLLLILRLSVEGERDAMTDPRRSLMKSLTIDKDDRRRGRVPSESSAIVDLSWDCERRFSFDIRRSNMLSLFRSDSMDESAADKPDIAAKAEANKGVAL